MPAFVWPALRAQLAGKLLMHTGGLEPAANGGAAARADLYQRVFFLPFRPAAVAPRSHDAFAGDDFKPLQRAVIWLLGTARRFSECRPDAA